MSRQSDFGRLFRRSASGPQEPIENYLSESLAIAIEHDDRPMRRALELVAWPDESHAFDASRVMAILPKTQEFLQPHRSGSEGETDGPGLGYLDLSLDVSLSDGSIRTGWVEVKAETGEHGEQLDDYAAHATHADPPPSIFTLSKYDIRKEKHLLKGIGWLEWKSLAGAIEEGESDGIDGRWSDLLNFLGEEGITWRSLECEPTEFEPHLEALIDVNERLKTRWPSVGLVWAPELLRKAALRQLNDNGRLTVTAGPLTYGLVPSKNGWLWSLTVGCKNYYRVPLDHVSMWRQADAAGLPSAWRRSTTRAAVLGLEASLRNRNRREDAAAWFSDALQELDALGVLQPYIVGLAAKMKNGERVALRPEGG
jgi:hypothetical protein